MIAELISVGTELLLGDILNTNVQFLSRRLADFGIDVYHTSVVGDNAGRLRESLERALERSNLVITTGGLGSTFDDITKRVVLAIAGRPTEINREGQSVIDYWFSDDKARSDNRHVIEFPEGSTVFVNHHGTAPGAYIPIGQSAVVIFPGPPREMKAMFEESFAPLLSELTGEKTKSVSVQIAEFGEYEVNCRFLEPITESKNPTFAPYISDDGAFLRITAKGDSEESCEALLNGGIEKVRSVFGDHLIGMNVSQRSEILVNLLKEIGETVAVAESITGGMLASCIVDIPGASDVFHRGFVVYSDEAKHDILGVPEDLLQEYSAVSDRCAEAMLAGLHEKTKADLLIATTGYAGPTGEEIGLCYIGVYYRGNLRIIERRLKGDRWMIRNRARSLAIDYAILLIKESRKGA